MMQSASGALPRPSPAQRWLALVLVSVAMFGNYYVYDAFGPVVDLLRTQEGFTYDQISMIFSAYSVAAVVVLLLGGYVIDRWGTKRSITLFALICLAAAALMASTARFETMLAGRFLLGIGAEPLIVAATAALAKWFKGKELSFAFGINLSIARLGSASADWSTSFASPLYSNWQDPLWLATGVAAVGVSAAMLYWMTESRLEGRVDLGQTDATDRFQLKGMYAFSASYWYIVGLCVVFYATVFPFRAFAIDYFQQAHGLDRETAGMLSSLLPVAAIVVTPLFGLWVDRVGRRSLFMAAGSLVMLPLFLLVTYAPPGPEIGVWIPFAGSAEVPLTLLVVMLLLGGVFSLIPAVMWPSVAYIVRESRLGAAYSMMTLCQQIGVALVPLAVGRFNTAFAAGPDNPAGYAPGMWFYTALAALGLLFSWLLWRAENGPHAHGLEYSSGSKPA